METFLDWPMETFLDWPMETFTCTPAVWFMSQTDNHSVKRTGRRSLTFL